LAGLTLFGIAALREKPLWGWGALTLAMSWCGWTYIITDSGGILEQHLVHVLSGILFSVGWVVWGYALRRRAPR
jgi:hypothetical protein